MLKHKNTLCRFRQWQHQLDTPLQYTTYPKKTPRPRLQNITESTNIRIKVQLGQPFSRRHSSLLYCAINHHQLAYFLPSPHFVPIATAPPLIVLYNQPN